MAPEWVAFIEPASSRNLGYPTQLPKPDYGNIVYAPHSYDNSAEQGMPFDPADRDKILANTAALRSEADAFDAALWIGEYGGPSSLSGIDDYLGDEWDSFGQVGASAMYWDYSAGDGSYGLLNADGSDKTDMLAIVTRPYPQRVAGDAVTYAWNTNTLTVTYTPKRSITAPTLIAVPPAFRPVTVTCGDCTFDTAEPGVRVLTPPSGDVATINVQTSKL